MIDATELDESTNDNINTLKTMSRARARVLLIRCCADTMRRLEREGWLHPIRFGSDRVHYLEVEVRELLRHGERLGPRIYRRRRATRK